MGKQELVEAVKAHASAHYEEGGWDYVIETMGDEDIARVIGGARTVKGAIKKVGDLAGLWDERRREVQSFAF